MQLLPEMLPGNEPLGPINRNSLRKLDAAISQPFTSFSGYYPYRYLYHRAAALFYFVIKDHCFENGNKRTAVVLTMLLLVDNGKMMNFTASELYDLACEVAESKAEDKDVEIERLKWKFKAAITNLSMEG